MIPNETLSYIKSLLLPTNRKSAGRKAWSIDLEQVWIPFFTATNTQGDTSIAPDALGCPIRLAYELDGSVRFSKTGRPVTKVAKPLADSIRVVRDNFTAGLVVHTEQVINTNQAGYKAQIALNSKAGKPIIAKDTDNLNKAMAIAMERAIAEAEALPVTKPEASKAKVPVAA